MPVRMMLLTVLLFVGLMGCDNYSGYDDNEFGQDFAGAIEDPLGSEYAKWLSPEGRQLIALMDRVSEEYAVCWAYFSVASGQSEWRDTGQDLVAQNLTIIASRVGRESDMAVSVAFRRQNHYVRVITGYYDDSNPSWDVIRDEFSERCNSAVSDVQGTITSLIEQE